MKTVNKKVLVIAAVFLAVAMLATPVRAVSPKKIPVTIDVEVIGFPTLPTEFGVTAGNVAHGIGDTLTLYYDITGGGISLLDGTAAEVGKFVANLNNPGGFALTDFGPVPIGKGMRIWSIVVDFGSGNTFEGHMTARGIQWVVTEGPFAGASLLWDGVQHGLLQGKGEYQGWTLEWKAVRVEGVDAQKEAYMLVP